MGRRRAGRQVSLRSASSSGHEEGRLGRFGDRPRFPEGNGLPIYQCILQALRILGAVAIALCQCLSVGGAWRARQVKGWNLELPPARAVWSNTAFQ